MKIELDPKKSVAENANEKYRKSKKAKKKLEGLEKAVEETEKKIEELEQKEVIEKKKYRKKRKRDWYEKFHWFKTTNDLLVIGGKTAQSNERVVKDHMQKGDLFFHADVHGAPVVVLKTEGEEPTEEDKEQAAQYAATTSKAFKQGVTAVDVYSVGPDQVKTSAKSGEYLPTGSFQIRGERQWFKNQEVKLAVSYDKENQRVVSGSPKAIQKNYGKHLIAVPGTRKKGEAVKKLKQKLENLFDVEYVDPDELLQALPAGKVKIKEPKTN